MYNRYIPQPDGSYRRSRMPDASRPHRPQPEPEPPCPEPEPQKPASKAHPRSQRRDSQDISTFLKRLLPKDFDTGDLLIIVLLLLMAGDCAEDQNTALLTLVLYFFM